MTSFNSRPLSIMACIEFCALLTGNLATVRNRWKVTRRIRYLALTNQIAEFVNECERSYRHCSKSRVSVG